MPEVCQERRLYPRVKAGLWARLADNSSGYVSNISEGGACLRCENAIPSPVISLQIYFPNGDGQFLLQAKLVWKQNSQHGQYSCGVEFTNLKFAQRSFLREAVIKTKIRGLLAQIEDLSVKANVCQFFLKDTRDYIDNIVEIAGSLSEQSAYSLDVEEAIERANNKILLKGYALELLLENNALMCQIKRCFRELVCTWIHSSALIGRTFCKPRTYPLECRMLEVIYDNQPVSTGIGVYFDKSFLKNPYAVAIRKCKDYIKTLLVDCIRDEPATPLNILAVNCSSCRELREILPELAGEGELNITCIDEDEQALACSRANLAHRIPRNMRLNFVKESMIYILKQKDCLPKYGKQHIIYNMGLADYLSDEALKKFIASLYRLLSAGGRLIITHRNAEKTFADIMPEWFCGLKPSKRNCRQVSSLFYESGISNFSLAIQSDNFAYIHYFILTKEAN